MMGAKLAQPVAGREAFSSKNDFVRIETRKSLE
jgi:hypothetical protein